MIDECLSFVLNQVDPCRDEDTEEGKPLVSRGRWFDILLVEEELDQNQLQEGEVGKEEEIMVCLDTTLCIRPGEDSNGRK